ncbi:MAG: ATP-binding protein [Leptospiraceae bacterium]|nr:ATP-binding protein [Leptospiraceae bacterium]
MDSDLLLENLYKYVFDSSELAIFIFEVIENPDAQSEEEKYQYKFIVTNSTHQKLTNISLKEIQNKFLWELNTIVPEEYLKEIKKRYDRCVMQKATIDYEEEIVIKNQKTYWFTKLVPVLKNDKVQFVIGMSIDISTRKELEIQVKNYNKLLDKLVNTLPVGIAITNQQYHIIFYNEMFLKMWNLKKEDIKDDKLIFLKVLRQIKNRKNVYPKIMEIVRNHKRGVIKFLQLEKRYIRMEIFPLIDEQKNFQGTIGIYVDRTKDIIQEKQLKQALKKAEIANKSKTEFLVNISHELRTPLTTIIGITELLQNQVSEDLLKFIYMIQDSSNILKNLIEDLLDLSAIELQNIRIENKPFLLNKPIDLLVNTYKIHCSNKRIDFYYETNLTNFPVVGDEKRIYQIINNLLSNALKFTSTGYIVLRILKEKEEENSIDLRIEVEDTGIGIPEDKINFIFDRFTKFDEFNINPTGIGVGLSLVKEFVRLMNGKIEVFSEVGKGTLFKIWLNLSKAQTISIDRMQEMSIEEILEKHKPLLENKKVLVAEDTLEIQMLIKKYLSDTGLIVEVVSNGLEVLETLKKKEFDLILLDIRMPVMDGINTFLQIDEKVKKKTPIAALTAYAMEDDINKTKELGFVAHISKPIKRKELLINIIKIFLQKNQ